MRERASDPRPAAPAPGGAAGLPAAAAVGALLAAWIGLLHGSALQGGWRVDDPWLLHHAVAHPSLLADFVDPAQWRTLSSLFFTPWLVLDYRLDAWLFGIEPAGFYARHLAMIWLVAMLSWRLMSRWRGMACGVAAAMLFVAGSPVAVVSQQLMARHYVTGLAFAALAILCWLAATERPARPLGWLALAGLAHLAAMLNKEVFVPLPLVLLCLGDAPWRWRVAASLPLIGATIGFVAWRAAMIGEPVGGYSGGLGAAAALGSSLATLASNLWGGGAGAVAGVGLLAAAAARALPPAPPRTRLLWLAAALAAAAPLAAVRVIADPLDARFGLLPWWGCSLALAAGLAPGPRGRGGPPAATAGAAPWPWLAGPGLLVAIGLAGWQGLSVARQYEPLAAAFDAHGRFMWQADASAAVVPTGALATALQFQYGLTALRRDRLGLDTAAMVPFAGAEGLRARAGPAHAYDAGCRCMKPLPPAAATPAPARPPAVAVTMDRTRRGLAWTYATEAGAACFVVFAPLNVSAAMPCAGRTALIPPGWVRGPVQVVVRAADGRWAATPLLAFPGAGEVLVWPAPGAGS